MILSELATLVSAQHGVFYTMTGASDHGAERGAGAAGRLRLRGAQAPLDVVPARAKAWSASAPRRRSGSCSPTCPSDYVRINSGLGEAVPLNIIVLPVLFEGSLRAVVELASFSPFSVTHQAFLDSITESVGIVLNTIQAATLTETLLKQSQSQAEELRSQQEELRGSNEDLARQARLLAEQNIVAEQKNLEVEAVQAPDRGEGQPARGLLEVQVRVHRQHVARAAHAAEQPADPRPAARGEPRPQPDRDPGRVRERHPLLGQGAAGAPQQHPRPGQGRVGDGHGRERRRSPSRSCALPSCASSSPSPQRRGSATRSTSPPARPESIVTDPQRLRQILKNLLANAFKFTERGSVHVQIGLADERLGPGDRSRWPGHRPWWPSRSTDTGIGIDEEQQQRIFEAFAQGDGTTARLYGGTGLGLSISRELVGLLGGEIDVASTRGEGSTFTVYLPTGRSRHPAHAPAHGHRARPDPTTRHRSSPAVARPEPDRARRRELEAPRQRSWRTVDRRREDPGGRRRAPQPLRDHGAPRARRRRRDGRGERRRGPRRAGADARTSTSS